MKKNQNILSKLWFSLGFIPILLFLGEFIWWNELDRFVFEWFIILTSSLILQLFMFKSMKYNKKIMNILYIVFSILISMFLSYFIYHFWTINIDGPFIFHGKWINSIVTAFFISAILFTIKFVLWIVLMIHLKHINTTKKVSTDLLKENEKLKIKNELLMKENEKYLKK